MATMYLNLAHAAGMASQNAVANQQHLNILGAAAVAAGTAGLLRNGFADQIEKLTPTERLDYLQKLLILATNPSAAQAAGADASSTGGGATASGGTAGEQTAKSSESNEGEKTPTASE